MLSNKVCTFSQKKLFWTLHEELVQPEIWTVYEPSTLLQVENEVFVGCWLSPFLRDVNGTFKWQVLKLDNRDHSQQLPTVASGIQAAPIRLWNAVFVVTLLL